jgi:DNA-binding CsgD family transcriptional regulator
MRRTSLIDSLSRREQTVLQWLIEGLRDKDIGPLLSLRTRSVTRLVREICDKLNARTRTQAACIFLSEQNAKIDSEKENWLIASGRKPATLDLRSAFPSQKVTV